VSAVIAALVVLHVACGAAAVLAGATAMLTVKGSGRHRRAGRTYVSALVGLCGSATALAAAEWERRWPLAVLGGVVAVLAASGLLGVRTGRMVAHIIGMGSAYVVMLTAFYVDNGPRLPLWDRLPPIAYWVLPAAVGLPVLVRAVNRRRAAERGRPGSGT
jgi:uncharacterized membrane protein